MKSISPLLQRIKEHLSAQKLQHAAFVTALVWVAKNLLVTLKLRDPITGDLALQFVHASQALLHIALITCAYMVFSRQLKPLAMAACAIAGTFISRWGWIDVNLHQFFVETSLYPPLFVSFAPDGTVNPQNAKVLLFAALTPALAWRVAAPEQRTLDRIFVLATIAAVLATSAIFHAVVPMGSLEQQKKDARYILKYATHLQGEELQRYCRHLAVQCEAIDTPQQAQALLSQSGVNAEWLGVTSDRQPGEVVTGVAGSLVGLRFNVRAVAYRAPSSTASGVLAIDNRHLQAAQYAAEIQFSFLCILAHATWLLLAFGLTALHASKKRYLLSRPKRVASD